MKKVLVFLALGLALYAETYEGCGKNEAEARNNLLSNLSVAIKSETKIDDSSSTFLGYELSSSDSSYNVSQKTNMKIKGIKTYKKGEERCASVTTKDIDKFLGTLIASSASRKISDLPSKSLPEQRFDVLNEWILEANDISSLIPLSTKYSSQELEVVVQKRNKYKKEAKELEGKIEEQLIARKEKEQRANRQYELEQQEQKDAAERKKRMDDPKIAALEAEAKRKEAKENERISAENAKQAKQILSNYNTKGSEFYTLSYGMSVPDSDFENFVGNTQRIMIEKIYKVSSLRHGPGFIYGYGDGVVEAELVYSAYFQLISEKLNISGYPLMPYFGFQAGLSYHEYEVNNTKYSTFGSTLSDKESFFRDYFSTRIMIGTDLAITDEFIVKLKMDKNFSQQKEMYFGIGLVFKL